MVRADFNASTLRATTPQHQIFGDLELVRFKCTACNTASVKYERAHTQEVSLANENHTTLELLLTDHVGEEHLDADFTCDGCHARGRGTKTTEMLHWPPVLVITLKRFTFDVLAQVMGKTDRHISYPMLFPVPAGPTYSLRAVVVHIGGGTGGHYVSYVRASDECWYFYNDSAVPQRVPDPRTVLQKEAYMLFYER